MKGNNELVGRSFTESMQKALENFHKWMACTSKIMESLKVVTKETTR